MKQIVGTTYAGNSNSFSVAVGKCKKMRSKLRLDFEVLNRYIEQQCGGKEFYFGCWSPTAFEFDINEKPANIHVEMGENWFAIRNGADQVDGLLFAKDNASNDGPELVIQRGYLADAGLHTYSDGEKIRDYWSADLVRRHNGVFSAVVISQSAGSVSLVTDIFGIGQLFYRKIGKKIFFSSTPALLSQDDDKKNTMSWEFRMLLGYIPGDDTLVEEIRSAPPASVLTFSGGQHERIERWYDYSSLATGSEPVGRHALEVSKEYFTKAIDRCRKLEYGKVRLPLSSGFDSRRIFAQLESRKADFETVTVQMPTGSGEDLDGTLAPQIAEDFGIKNVRFRIPDAKTWHEYDVQRIYGMDAQTDYHTWSVCIFNHFKGQKITLYDGLGGDVLCFYGWNFKYNPDLLLPKGLFRAVKDNVFPTSDQIRKQLKKLYDQQPKGINQDLISFCLWQSRSSTGIWTQQQAHPGQLILCPYFDLDYIEKMLQFSVASGQEYLSQKELLKEFWPELSRYSGSGDIPENPEYIGEYSEQIKRSSLRQIISKTVSSQECRRQFKKMFKPLPLLFLYLSKYSLFITRKIEFWMKDIVEIVFWWQSRPIIIKLDEGDEGDDDE